MKDGNCLRVYADWNQLNQCRSELEQISESIDSLSDVMKLAGNGVRLRILFLLYNQDKLCVCDLSDILDMKISGISQHLKKLKDGGLVQFEKVGQTIFYYLSPSFKSLFQDYFTLIEANKMIRLNA